MFIKKLKCVIFIVVALFLSGGCKNDPITPNSNYFSDNTNCDTMSVTYDNFVKSFVTKKNCILCHTNDLGYIPFLNVHDSIKNYLQDTAKAKLFMVKITTNHRILDSSNFNTACEISKFRSWIRMGAH